MKRLLFLFLLAAGCSDETTREAEKVVTVFEVETYFLDDVNAYYEDAELHGIPKLPKDNLIVKRLPSTMVNETLGRSYKEGEQWYVEINYFIPHECWRGIVYREMSHALLNKQYDCTVPIGYHGLQNIMCETYKTECWYKMPGYNLWHQEVLYLFTGKAE